MASSRRSDRGATLIELLLAVTIIGLAVVALVGGLAASVFASDIHRKQATSDAAARSIAESIKSPAVLYSNCATATTYPTPLPTPTPTYSATVTVTYWDGSSSPAAFSASCPAQDKGLQQISVTVFPTDQRASETVVVLKRRR